MSAGSVNYRRGIRASVRGYWTGSLDFNQFFDAMMSIIRRGITVAWHEGAKECGIAPAELTPEEKMGLQRAIVGETNYISDFAAAIAAGSKANGGKMGPLMGRAELWINRYEEIRQRAMVMACGDSKTRWTLGVSEHCSSCVKLAGKVKRNSFWQRTGILPRVPGASYLECQGFNCQCTLEPTDGSLSRGPLPRLP